MSEATERERVIELIGEVRAVDVDAGVLALRLSDDEIVKVHFGAEHERVITTALREHDHQRLRLEVRLVSSGSRRARPRYVAEEVALVDGGDGRPIWEIGMEIGARVPESEWSKVPSDLARNLDHYLYGSPKIEETSD